MKFKLEKNVENISKLSNFCSEIKNYITIAEKICARKNTQAVGVFLRLI